MDICFYSTPNAPKNVNTQKDAARWRKRCIIQLIINFLQDQGLFQTMESLMTEAPVTKEYQVCDNVDLEMIVQEYSSYHYLKFNKYPTICKKRDIIPQEPVRKTSAKITKPPTDVNETPSKPKKESEVISEASLTITQLNMDSNKLNKVNLKTDEKLPESRLLSTFCTKLPLELRPLAEFIYQSTMYSDIEKNTWEQVIGLENAKQSLKEAAIYSIKYPWLFQGLTSAWTGILLYGPPGTGKTLLAKALAHESHRTFFNVSPSTILSKWKGESEKNVKILFDLARFFAPSIIFLDEVEALASSRDCPTEHEATRRMKSQILMELDGLGRNSQEILLLATSNLPWEIDAAFLRRMEKRIYIPLPDKKCREEIIKNNFNTSNFDVTSEIIQKISESTDGYSGSDLHILCKEAAMTSIRRLMFSQELTKNVKKTIKEAELDAVLLKNKPSVKHLSEKYDKWKNHLGCE